MLKLHWQIFIAFFAAIFLGLFFGKYFVSLRFLGDIFLRALKMVIVPLVFSSIVSGITSLNYSKDLGRLGVKTIVYYLSTSIFAILTGLILVNIISPGVGADLGFSDEIPDLSKSSGSIGDVFLRLIPSNVFEALLSQDMLAIIFFAVVFGIFINQIDDRPKKILIDFFNALFEVIMKLTSFIIRFAPVGIFGIVIGFVVDQADDKSRMFSVIQHLGLYIITVSLGLFIHMFLTLPLILKFFGKVNPYLHFNAMSIPLITAFSTSSSSATLPLTIQAVEKEEGVSNKISSFVLPLGATINMDGTALYECVAAIFIAQAYGIELDFFQQVIVVITALLASIGAAGIPMAGLVMLSVILTAVGLPLEGVGLILSVDRILDMCRTAVNVFSDSCGAVLIAKTEGEKLKI